MERRKIEKAKTEKVEEEGKEGEVIGLQNDKIMLILRNELFCRFTAGFLYYLFFLFFLYYCFINNNEIIRYRLANHILAILFVKN